MSSLHIVIPSIRNTYTVALNTVIASIPNKTKYVIVFQNEPEENYKTFDDGHIEITIKNNLYEYGSWIGAYRLIEAGLLPADGWYLFIHDTCKFNSDSISKTLKLIEQNPDKDIIWLSENGQCNLCIIRYLAIKAGHDKYKNMLTMDKMVAIEAEWNQNDFSPKRCEAKQMYVRGKSISIRKADVYNNNVLRQVILFRSINIEKYYVPVRKSTDHPMKP